MRPLARYAILAKRGAPGNPADLGATSVVVQDWLKGKGWNGTSAEFQRRDGETAKVDHATITSRSGRVMRWSISEPTEDRRTLFRTQLALAQRGDELAVYCELSASLIDNALAPLHVHVRCPAVIRTLMTPGSEWCYGDWRLAATALIANGREQGEVLVRLLRDQARRVPIVVVSSRNRVTFQRGIATSIAEDLAGLATVVQADEEAMWQVSHSLGRDWSCYMGAIRLYWPLPIPGSNPARHPLWTPFRLLSDGLGVDEAAWRLRNYLRGRLMAVSVFAVASPDLFRDLEAEFAQEQRELEFDRVRSTNDWQQLAEAMLLERDEWQAKADAREAENNVLRQKVYLQQIQATFVEGQAEDQLQPDQAPSTLAQAVQQARVELVGKVVFGRDVERGVEGLNPDAGPPQKVLDYLRALGYMVEERRKGPLQNSQVAWLEDVGVTCSGESETDRRNAATMRRRQWDDGTRIRQFELHLKPNDKLAPDLCVRIYFDWDEPTRQVVVGWVGRHPD